MAAGLPTSVIVAIEFSAGVWTDVSSLVRGDSIEIRVGREPGTDIQPGTLSLQLDNADGRFTPDNPTSVHYPNFVEGKRIRVQVVKSATTYTRFVGRITALEPDFPTEPSQALTTVTAVDGLGDLARITLPSYPEAIQRQNASGSTPVAYYPLTDANEHVGMFDPMDIGSPLTVWNRTSSSGSIEARGDETLGDGRQYVKLTSGKGLWHATSGIPVSVHGGVSGLVYLYLCVKVSSSSYGEVVSIGNQRRDAFDQLVRIRWTATGFILENYANGALTGSTPAVAADDGWHQLQMQVGGAATSAFAVDDGVSQDAGVGVTGSMRFVSIGSDMDLSAAHLTINKDLRLWTTKDVLPGNGLTLSAYTQDVSITANATGLQQSFSWTTSPTTIPADPGALPDRNGLESLIAVADSQSGTVYAVPSTSATQTIQLLANADSRASTVALTIDAEGDLAEGPTMVRSIEGRVSAATASSPNVSVAVTDSTITDVGSADVQVDTALYDPLDLRSVATDRIARGREQHLRPSSLTVDLATALNDLYAAFYALTPGERVRLSGLPSAYFGVTYIDGYVEGWTERPGVTGYEVTFDLSPADAPPEAKADDATYGRATFGDGVCTLTSAITSSATSLSLTFTGSELLSTAAGDYPLDLDINGERVTVASAPAGGSSPRTLTVTRGVAPTVARAHSAGEPVEIWLGARAAL